MKIKFLLLLLFMTSVFLRAQEPYQNLIISEVRMDQAHHSYMEICNMGSVSVDLAQFEIGTIGSWTQPYNAGVNERVMLPARMLNPGETFVIATVREWANEQHLINPDKYGESNTKDDTWRLADMQLHQPESPGGLSPTDSISVGYGALTVWGGSSCFYIRHHYIEGDSVVVDAANGVFTQDDGTRPETLGASDVAGVPGATANSILIRKFSVKKGNLDWEQARGVDITASEWLPVPILVAGGWEAGRKEFWTMGNHGDYRLNASTIKSKSIKIDWTNNTMDVDWGARNNDSIMNEFDFAPGIAWKYHRTHSKLDSAYTSVRTGDSLTLYATGNQLDFIKFALKALPPTSSENRVIPKNARNNAGWYTPFEVSEGIPGMDTISEVAFATRVDTLFKYLEKPEAATWKMVWADGTERPDLINGDILKVTAANGTSVKNYFIKVTEYRPNHNANLAAITWPDIPEFYKGIFGWAGDTIPNFSPTKLTYSVLIPKDVQGVPSFIAKAENPDTKIQVKRATSLFGSDESKTIKFFTTAEDDTTTLTYSIRLEKEKDLKDQQPYEVDPYFSQFTFRADWRQFFLEIANPGTRPLDLSRYVVVRTNSASTADAINLFATDVDFANRYRRYVPGYVWQDEASWQVQPGMLEPDFGVNPIVDAGDVFVLAWAYPTYKDVATRNYPDFEKIDVNFKNGYNPWGIEFTEDALANGQNVCGGWYNDDWILYKILNDSILDGTKPLANLVVGAGKDAIVIDVIGRCNGQGPGLMSTSPTVNFDQNSGLKRLPHIYKGNPEPGASFLDTLNNKPSEWLYTNDAYWQKAGYPWPETNSMSSDGIGTLDINPIIEFISTLASVSFDVSKGFSLTETIKGAITGITVSEFMQRIITVPGQTITLESKGTTLTDADLLPNGSTITVVSPNKENTTKYTISVGSTGLDNNATLTSKVYTISVNGNIGTVSGFDAGIKLSELMQNISAPEKASLFGAFKADGSYAPFVQMKNDSTYADVLATDKILLEVLAQDGVTRVEYTLQPKSSVSDAYVLSNVYDVNQEALMIKLVSDGINVSSFLNNLIPAYGATMRLINKSGQVRDFASVYEDDKLEVTAKDGKTKKVYSLELYSDFAARYNAFLYSDVYLVTQATKRVTKVPASTTVEDFFNKIEVSMGATYVLVDSKGVEYSTGVIQKSSKLLVTSNNGIVVTKYTITLDKVDVETFSNLSVKVYPNPTNGPITIDGIKAGNVIDVYNAYGRKVHSFKAETSKELTNIEDQPAGIYIVVVNNGNQRIAQYKMIKK